MQVSVSDAKGQLTELVRRAEAGEEVILTRFGRKVARLVPETVLLTPATKRALIEEVRAIGRQKKLAGPAAARSQDFLYGEDGLP